MAKNKLAYQREQQQDQEILSITLAFTAFREIQFKGMATIWKTGRTKHNKEDSKEYWIYKLIFKWLPLQPIIYYNLIF